MNTSLGSAVIEIALQGISKVQSDLTSIKGKLQGAGQAAEGASKSTKELGDKAATSKTQFAGFVDTIGSIGKVAAIGFGIVTTAMTAFWRVADPKGADDMSFAFARMSIQLGRIFVPVLRTVTEWINKVADWLSSLSDETRESVMWWTTVAVAVAGFLMVLPTLISVLTGVAAAVGLVKVALIALATTNPFGWVAIGIGLLVSLVAWLATTGGAWESFSTTVSSVCSGITSLFSALWAFLSPIFELIKVAWDIIAAAWSAAFSVINGIIGGFSYVMSGLGSMVSSVTSSIGESLGWLGDLFGSAMGGIQSLVTGTTKAVSYMGAVMRQIWKGNWTNAFEEATKEMDAWEEEQKAKAAKAKEAAKPKPSEKKDSDKFRGEVQQKAPSFVGIAELSKKIQGSQSEDLQSRIAREQLEQQKKNGKTLEKIAENTDEEASTGGGGSWGND